MASADGTTVHTYLYDNSGALIRETRDYPDGTQDIMEFLYDQSGRPYAFVLNNVTYYYVLNLQGDIVRLVNTAGTTVVSYVYNAWGKILSTQTTSLSYSATVAAKNPLRYRGYYFDTDTSLYYVSSRYYDPALGRFLNADDISLLGADGTVLSHNQFAYCKNDPVNRFDDNGNWSLPNWAKVAVGSVATVAAMAVTVATGGAAIPVLIGVAVSTAASGAIGYATGGVEGMKNGLANGFMLGGLSALGGSLVSAGVKAVKTARQGITIGRNMSKGFTNVQNATGLTDTAIYSSDAMWKPLRSNYYNWLKTHLGEAAANKASYMCNKIYIKTMRRMGAVIYDSGLNGASEAGMFYGMELEELAGYVNLVKMY